MPAGGNPAAVSPRRILRAEAESRGWPIIDVTRRSIEETAAAIIRMCNDRLSGVSVGEEA